MKIRNIIIGLAALLCVSASFLMVSGVSLAESPVNYPKNFALTLPNPTSETYVCEYYAEQPTDPENSKSYNNVTRLKDDKACIENNPIYAWLSFFIDMFVIVIVVGSGIMIAFAGLEYITSAGSPDKVKSARDKIRNVVIGLLTLVFLYAFLQWLIPGGVF